MVTRPGSRGHDHTTQARRRGLRTTEPITPARAAKIAGTVLFTLIALAALAACGGGDGTTTAQRPTEVPTAAEVLGQTVVPTAMPATTPTPAAASAGGAHVIAAGETLGTIASTYGVTVEQLAAANGITDVNLVYVGQELVIPTPTSATSTQSDGTQPDGAADGTGG